MVVCKWLTRSGETWGYYAENLSNCGESCELEFFGLPFQNFKPIQRVYDFLIIRRYLANSDFLI